MRLARQRRGHRRRQRRPQCHHDAEHLLLSRIIINPKTPTANPCHTCYSPAGAVWQFVVIPEQISADKQRHILGGQGNIWTEYIPNYDHLEYMAFPRAIAIADVLWNHPAERDYADLVARLKRHLPASMRWA